MGFENAPPSPQGPETTRNPQEAPEARLRSSPIVGATVQSRSNQPETESPTEGLLAALRDTNLSDIDPVEVALAYALKRAAMSEQWATVELLARELQARREARDNVIPLDAERRKSRG